MHTLAMCNPCQHCKQRQACSNRRGLCDACYYTRSIREKYPTGQPEQGEYHRKRKDGCGKHSQRKPASFPTRHMPGTIGKIEVLAYRADNHEELYHPDDAKLSTTDLDTGQRFLRGGHSGVRRCRVSFFMVSYHNS